jgi:hypothetical protein
MKHFTFISILGVLSCLWMLSYTSCQEKDPLVVQGNIEGTIVDAETGQAISGVNVTIVANSNTTFSKQSKTTGNDGQFNFNDLEAGEYKLTFVKEGYEDNSKTIDLKGGQTSSGDVIMKSIKSSMDVTPTLLDFGTTTGILSVEIRNSGKGELSWNIVEDLPWLSVNPTSGKTTTEVSTVTVTVDRSLITEESKVGSFVINSNDGSRTVNVSVGKPVPVMSVTPATLDFGETETEKSVNISNVGVGTLSYTATSAQSWITLENGTGSLTTDTKIVKVTVTRAGLSPNSYTGNIVVNSNSNSVTIPVSMNVIQPSAPDLLNGQASGITYNSAQVSGTLTSLGSSAVTQHGHCWSTNPNPTTNDNKTTLGGTGVLKSFTSNITGLSANTVYYVKAYATNTTGTTYSDAVTFTTLPPPTMATVQAISTANVGHNSLNATGNLTVLGDGLVTDYGFCYSASNATPAISDSKASKGQTTQTGQFTVEVTGLQASTQYYLRPYATNSMGTAYGGVIMATTTDAPPVVTSGLVAYYTFDNSNCNESQGKTQYNGIKQGNGNPVWSSDIPNNNGKSLQLNNECYFNIPTSPLYYSGNRTRQPYSFNLWIKTMEGNGTILISHQNSNSPGIAIITDKIYCWGSETSFGSAFDLLITDLLLDGNWHMLTVTYTYSSNKLWKLYIDGTYLSQYTYPYYDISVSTPMIIGRGIIGSMDNVRVYNRELVQSEITEIYNAKQ